jgi:hypothetical protein
MTVVNTDLVTVPLFSQTVAQSPVPGMVMLNARRYSSPDRRRPPGR